MIVEAAILGMILFIILFKYESFRVSLFNILVGIMFTIKWVIIIVLLVGITNTPNFYARFGWTPLSLIAGDYVYEKYKQNHPE